MQQSWSLQDAKAKFSAVVERAQRGGPQWVTRHGKPAVVVVSVEQFGRLTQQSGDADLVRFFRDSPLAEAFPEGLRREDDTGREVVVTRNVPDMQASGVPVFSPWTA